MKRFCGSVYVLVDLSYISQHFAFLLGRPSIRGCSAYGLVLCLPRRCSLRLLLSCTCPPLCAGALWPMPAWVWRDVRLYIRIHIYNFCLQFACTHADVRLSNACLMLYA